MGQYIGGDERRAFLAMAIAAATAAGSGGAPESPRYAACAVTLLKAAIGSPLTLDEAQALLERWTPVGTPLEQDFCAAIEGIKARRALSGSRRHLDS